MEEIMEKPFKHYITVFKDGNLLPNRKMVKCPNPKISLIIPMYNEEKNIIPVIRSIQNQNLQEIEIVCVNDNSNDKTLSILESLQKEDPRIEIITNKSNRGVIYNRIYGAIQSKGEYVTFIDADDGLCNIDILEKAYNVATKEHNEKIDIVHYQTCSCTIKENGEMEQFLIFFTFNPKNINQVIRQPEIGDNYMQKQKNVTDSGLVFGQIYRRELIQRAADYIGPHIWNQNLIFCDDFLLCFACMKMAKSIVNIDEIGYWHLNEQSVSSTSLVWEIDGDKLKYPEKTNKKIGDYTIIMGRILELTENEPQTGEFREDIIKGLLREDYLQTFARSIYYDTFINLFVKLYNWKYIDKEAKKRIQNYLKLILSFKIQPEKKFSDILK
jgi:glycosyltransferase involved in cell wall biosynthesis